MHKSRVAVSSLNCNSSSFVKTEFEILTIKEDADDLKEAEVTQELCVKLVLSIEYIIIAYL